MSELRANTISDAAGTGPVTLTAQSASKAWANFDGDPISIRDSLNLSSVTDNGVGDYTPNYTNSFANTNYAVMRGLMVAFSTNWAVAGLAFRPVGGNSFNQNPATKSTSAFRMISGNENFADLYDASQISYSIQGDLS